MGHVSRHSSVSASSSFARVLAGAVLAMGAISLGVVAGCSSDDTSAPAAKAPLVASCPSTFAATNGAACKTDGQVCTPSVVCPSALQTSQCTCTNGAFVCRDAVDVVAVGAEPQCISSGQPAPAACPATVVAANGAACTQTWRTCTYVGKECTVVDPTGRPQVDTCFCRANANGVLAFYCETAPCSPPLPPVVVPPVVDAGHDASRTADGG